MSTTTPLRSRRSRSCSAPPLVVEPAAAVAEANASNAFGGSATADDVAARLHFTRVDRLPCFIDDALIGSKLDREVAASEWSEGSTAAVRATGDAALRSLLRRVVRRDGRPASDFKGLPRPASAYHDGSRRLSVLRTDWSTSAAQLAVDWSSPAMRLEFMVGRDVVFSGRSEPRVRVAGVEREPVGDWTETVWLSDAEVDYLELELKLSGGVRLERQLLLTRRDGWLYLADAAYVDAPAAIEAELSLPQAADARFAAAADTRDAELRVGKRRLRVVPPALPEWRVERSAGRLEATAGRLVLTQASEPEARALYVPLALNFDPRRVRGEPTWRRLTVGEHLAIVRPDRAVGYRLQLGREHWLVYRSLTPRANRTVLGVNLQTDFLFSRFTTDGESEPLVETEQ